MAELTISSDEIRSAIESYVSSLETETSREEVGTVIDGSVKTRLQQLQTAF